jgi:hypothetical protein
MRALRRLQREQGVAVPFSMVMTHRKRSESMPLYGQSRGTPGPRTVSLPRGLFMSAGAHFLWAAKGVLLGLRLFRESVK